MEGICISTRRLLGFIRQGGHHGGGPAPSAAVSSSSSMMIGTTSLPSASCSTSIETEVLTPCSCRFLPWSCSWFHLSGDQFLHAARIGRSPSTKPSCSSSTVHAMGKAFTMLPTTGGWRTSLPQSLTSMQAGFIHPTARCVAQDTGKPLRGAGCCNS